VYSHAGAITGATVVFQDVTRARLVDQLRNNLVATMAHEFRSPLTSLRMAIHLCLEQTAGPLNDRQADLLYAAREDCERLQSMIEELLDLARIQEGHVELHRRPTVAIDLIDEVVGTYQKPAAARGIVLQGSCEADLREVDVDRDRIQLVLSNLIGNAIHRLPAGGSIEVHAASDGAATRFEVMAIGSLSADDGSQPLQPEAGDFGSVIRQIVEAHGGTIGTEAAGRRVIFWFEIPPSQNHEPQQARA
jgi:signal transduction histidine kinase